MATPTIPNGEEYFFPVIYEGNGAGQRVGKFVPFTDNGTIANSVIYNRSDNPKLTRTPSSNGNRKTFTISVWYKPTDLGTRRILCAADTSGSDYGLFELNENNKLYWTHSSVGDIISTRTFEDTSKFYHFMLAVDTTQSTASNRVKLYADGDLITSLDSSTYPSQDFQTNFNSTSYPIAAGTYNSLTGYATGGYLAEFNFVDGTALTPSTFGLTDTSTGRWIPKTLSGITYGTNGFRLTFADSSAFGDDLSGNTNDFTATNLASTDQTTDSPTQNHNNMGGSINSGNSNAEGNLETTTASSGTGYIQTVALPAFGVNKGKWYWEVKVTTVGTALYGWKDDGNAGGSQASTSGTIGSGGNFSGALSAGSSGSYSAGSWFIDHDYNNEVNYTTVATNDVLMFALDLDNNKGYCGKNGTWFNSADPANGTGAIGGTQRANGVNKFYPMVARMGNSSSVGEWNFGQRSFAYTPPTGFSAWQQDNLPETAKGISGLVWTKNRDSTDNHQLYDSSRGKQLLLSSDIADAESTVTDGLQKFLAGGQQIEDSDAINTAGESFVSWNWVVNSGTTSTNTDGSITTTTQVNSTAGFSIIQFTGTEANATIGHGLSQTPDFIIIKALETHSPNGSWVVWLKSFAANTFQYLELNIANDTSTTFFNNTLPTSSVINLGANFNTNMSGNKMICYAWNEVPGFSKFGKFVGNGDADGPFVYTGFKPKWLLVKANNVANWYLCDAARSLINPVTLFLHPDRTDADYSNFGRGFDFLSNGFKVRQEAGYGANYSGVDTYYMAFAEHPFVGDGTSPVTAR